MTLGPGLRRTQSVDSLPVLSKIPRRVASGSAVDSLSVLSKIPRRVGSASPVTVRGLAVALSRSASGEPPPQAARATAISGIASSRAGATRRGIAVPREWRLGE